MALDYDRRLRNIENRRFDQELNESVLSKSFSSTNIPKNIKYLMESMLRLDKKYNDRTYEAAKRVQNHLENGYNLHFDRAYRTQGSVTTSTNIKVHSDFDLLNIIDRYHYTAPDLPNNSPYTASEPNTDIKSLRSQSEKILSNIYDEVDKSGVKSISIFNKSLNRKVDIVFCFWYNTKDYEEKKNEYYRGVYLFDFQKEIKIRDYPFAHISQVNSKGDNTNDGSRKAIRLMKNLKADSESNIDLSSFHITTIVHGIENNELYYRTGGELSIAKAVSSQLSKLISDSNYRQNTKSPNGTEFPITSETVPEMKKIKIDLDALIEDVQKEFYYGYFQKGELIYS